MKFRPCIDLHNGAVKQIVGSTISDLRQGADNSEQVKENFASELPSAHYAELYRRDKLRGGHIIMLGPGNEDAALSALRAYPGGFHAGGGVNPSNAQKYLQAGASHVIVTSYVFREGAIDFDRLAQVVEAAGGKERLVLDLSCRKKPGDDSGDYFVVTDRWQRFTDFRINEANLEILAQHCDEFLVHGVDVEGMRVGVIEDLIAKLAEWSPIPVTYAGGARGIDDLEVVKRVGKGRVDLTVGSALDIFGGELSYDQVVKWHYANLVDTQETLDRLSKEDAMRVLLARASRSADAVSADAAKAFKMSLHDC